LRHGGILTDSFSHQIGSLLASSALCFKLFEYEEVAALVGFW
jgi:hypothetical protein